MAKVLKFKEVNSDVEKRMKEFEKLRIKLKSQISKDAAKKAKEGKETKGLLKSISDFFTDSPKETSKVKAKK
ncbi:hypothetical protein ACEN2I_07640 [Flavobacterium sp. W22_SRS_FK3]|uniref:hypothetical protein n=1 Tax=Flavobacterium sp. W22_SRS_FK3 TaxID=3240275 RepID=UPI003F934BB4